MRFAIDGTTGLLGRNLLFEILKQNLKALDKIEILILGKGANGLTLEQRMNAIIYDDGFNYLAQDRNSELFNQIKSRIYYIDFDLTKADLGISNSGLAILKNGSIDYYFHNAALLNFGDSEELANKLNLINFESSKTLMRLIKELRVKEFVYTSTAYHAGSTVYSIKPNFINTTDKFRNPYEKSKLNSELYIVDTSKKYNLNFKIFRPTTIAGRLIENEIGAINKFDVFYEWARWILKYKIKLIKDSINHYNIPYEIDFRITAHDNSLMNIIPADIAAKLMYYAITENLESNFFHLVNDFDTPTFLIAEYILKNLNISGYKFVDDIPNDKNRFEEFYYRTVGKVFTPYINDPPLHYNNDNLKPIIKKYGLECPEMNETNFQKLMDYAKKHNFGIEKN